MTLNEYQQETERTAGKDDLAILALGLVGEAGEFADLVKKHLGHGHCLDFSKANKELGDVLWYIARLAAYFSWDLEYVAAENLAKLLKRYPDGFSTTASINREESGPP